MGHRALNKGLDRDPRILLAPAEAEPDFVAAFARGLRVIRAFGENAQMLTLSQVAERAELTPAGARRLLLTLVKLGYAGAKGRHYFLTPKVLSLGYAFLSSLPLYHFAQPILEDLVAKTGETCAVSMLDGADAVYVLRIPLRQIMSGDFGIGTRRPAHATSMGRVLLGALSDRDFAEYIARADLRAYTDLTITDPARLRERVIQDRAQGYAWVAGELAPHVSGLSVPILDAEAQGVAALNISFNRPKITRAEVLRKYLPQLQAAAEAIGRSLRLRERSMSDRLT